MEWWGNVVGWLIVVVVADGTAVQQVIDGQVRARVPRLSHAGTTGSQRPQSRILPSPSAAISVISPPKPRQTAGLTATGTSNCIPSDEQKASRNPSLPSLPLSLLIPLPRRILFIYVVATLSLPTIDTLTLPRSRLTRILHRRPRRRKPTMSSSSKISFATFLIICPTCFFLGILFTNWSYDHHTLWNSVPPSEQILTAIESHYTLLSSSPHIIVRVLHIIIAVGLFGFVAKLYKPSESNMLFDGASLVMYMIGLIMYGTNVVRGLKTVASGEYGEEVGRVDTLRVMAASQVILALVLVGVLVLQSGQWYAERKEREEVKRMEEEEEAAKRKGKKKN